MESQSSYGVITYINPLVYWILVCYAITSIIVEATITKYIRILPGYVAETTRYYPIKMIMQFIHSLLNCFLCSSVWICGIMSIFILENTNFYQIVTDAMLGTTILWFMHCIEIRLVK